MSVSAIIFISSSFNILSLSEWIIYFYNYLLSSTHVFFKSAFLFEFSFKLYLLNAYTHIVNEQNLLNLHLSYFMRSIN